MSGSCTVAVEELDQQIFFPSDTTALAGLPCFRFLHQATSSTNIEEASYYQANISTIWNNFFIIIS